MLGTVNLPMSMIHQIIKVQFILLAAVLLWQMPIHGQSEVRDSLRQEIGSAERRGNIAKKDTSYVNLLTELGDQMRFYNSDSLLLLSKKALKLSKNLNYRRGETHALILLGDYYSDKGINIEGISFYRKALVIAHELQDNNLILNIQNDIAGEHAYMGDIAKALSVYLLSLELADQEHNLEMQSIMNENVANLYVDQKEYDEALKFYDKVMRINKELGNEQFFGETMSNMASLYADTGDLEKAMFNINKSISIFEKSGILDWLAYSYEIKGKIYLKQEKYRWALYWYNQSELMHQKIQDDRGKIDLLNGIAEANYGLGNDSIAESYALQAYDISKRIHFMDGIKKCAKTLYKLDKDRGDFVSALKYHELFQAISDTLSRNENKKSLAMLRTKMAYDEQKKALMAESKKEIEKQQSYIYAAVIFLVITIFIALFIYRNEKNQKKLYKELEAKKLALEIREGELKVLNHSKDKLFSIIGHDLRGPVGALQELLKMHLRGEIGTEEFLSFIPKLSDDVNDISFTLNNLLSWGQSQMNGIVTKPVVAHLEHIVSDNISLLSKIAENKSIRIINRVKENTLIFGDSNQIDVVVRNLVSNALKFTPENGMIVIEALPKRTCWEITVRDTGVGMEQTTVGKLFTGDSNLTTYGTNNEKGTGLGLALCKEMIENNKGTIWVESIPRKGTIFHFTLPKGEKKYQKVG